MEEQSFTHTHRSQCHDGNGPNVAPRNLTGSRLVISYRLRGEAAGVYFLPPRNNSGERIHSFECVFFFFLHTLYPLYKERKTKEDPNVRVSCLRFYDLDLMLRGK